MVTYLPVNTIGVKVSSSTDDAEEYIYTPANDAFRGDGSMDIASSDIEFGAEEANGKNPQISGLRFTNLAIPKGAQIQWAYIQLTVDATNKNEDPANYLIFAEDNANPATFGTAAYNLTSRAWTSDSVEWNLPAGSWNAVGNKENTPNIASLIQALVNKNDWSEGNPMAFFVTGTGVREAESFDGAPDLAAELIVAYVPVATNTYQIAASSDDAEEYIYTPANDPFRGDGSMDIVSSDIELGAEEANGKNPQISGLRFTGIDLPAQGVINSAYIEFTVDATNKNEDPANYVIYAEYSPSPASFGADAYNITSRAWTTDSVIWNVPAGSWNTVGGTHQTANIAPLVKALVDQPGWVPGGSMAFFIKGTGVREAESFDGSAPNAARLVVEHLQAELIYFPELIKEFSDIELVEGWNFSLDLNGFFRDLDSELSFSAAITGTDSLPAGISLVGNQLSGAYNGVGSFNITVTATSEGKSVSDEFVLNYIAPSGDFTLAIFHNNDGESHLLPDSIVVNGVPTVGGSIGQFKAVLDSLRAQAVARGYQSIMLSSGDNFLAGLEYNASVAAGTFYDAIALDSLGYDAICLGNHDFDLALQYWPTSSMLLM
ncbi:MAG: hypothetical protein HC896_09825 [Bacteroidales bacterium]|nr:hypothetical protein [Bacteroidales bacterium]